MEKIYIFGHRNPDTDSVTSAISLSYLKNELGMNTVPIVLSSINNESKYALDYFKVKEPMFLNDIKILVKDLDYTKNYTVNTNDSIYTSYHKMEKVGISKIPVVSDKKKLLGIVSMKEIAKNQLNEEYAKVDTTYDNIINAIKGESVTKYNDEIKGNLIVAAYKSTTFMEEVKLTNNDILIVGDRHSIIEYAVISGVKLIIITGNHQIKEEHIKIAKANKVNIITTKYDTLFTARIFNLANNVTTIVNNEQFLCVNENESLQEFIKIANRTRYSYYPVLGKDDKCLGIIRYSDVNFNKKKKVILVDHNSYEQSAVGLEEAEILEIIDHHNIGTVGTNMPINFRNMPVGSTNTIIYILFKENNVDIPPHIAGLMMSGIISDTMLLTSPTTTEYDEIILEQLSDIAKVDYREYGFNLLKAGCSIEGKTKEEVLKMDFKVYPVEETKIGLGQVSTTDFNDFDIEGYVKLLNETSKMNNYLFTMLFVTDIINGGVYILYSDNCENILKDAFELDEVKEGVYVPNIISRKKQILPALMRAMENN